MIGMVAQIDGWDPVDGIAVTLRGASHDEPSVCHLNGQTWWPAIARLPALRYDLFDGAFAGQIETPTTSFALQSEPWPDFGRYTLADARVRLWTGEPGAAWAEWTLRFDGRATAQPKLEDGQAQIEIAVDDRWLDNPLLATYAGTTGAEGRAEFKGQVKPLALGAPRFVSGKLIDPVNSVFQVSAYGAIQGFEAALERLLRFGAPVANYATYASLIAAAVPAGRWATCNALGLARFGAPPTGQVSFLLQGDAAGPNGWARKPGQLIRRLALLSGGAGKIGDASLDALDTARPYNLSLYLDEQTTARALIQDLAASVNAVAGVSWTGQLFVLPIGIGAAGVTLAADGFALPPVESVAQAAIGAPWKKIALTAERAWTVHQLGDIAFTAALVDMGDYAAGTTYREGNIVQNQGSTWLYINPAATAGNAPPTLPTTENTFWKVLAKAGEAGATARIVRLTSDRELIHYNSAGALSPASQTTTLTAQRQNFTAPVVWTVVDAGGGNHPPDVHLGGAGDTRTLTAAKFSELASFNGAGGRTLKVTATVTEGGVTSSESITLQRVDQGASGLSAPLLKVQWSVNGSTAWHDTYATGDVFYRQSNDNGATYGPAIRGVGENGGADGVSVSVVFRRLATVPATPAINTGDPPPNWSDGPPGGTGFLWMSKAEFRDGAQLTAWSAPQRITGDQGPEGPAGPAGAGALVKADGSGTVNLPSNTGTTTQVAFANITLNAGGKLRLTLGASQPSAFNIASVVTTSIKAYVDGAMIFSGNVLIDSDGVLDPSGLAESAARLLTNSWTGTVGFQITSTRGGPTGSTATFALNYILEQVST